MMTHNKTSKQKMLQAAKEFAGRKFDDIFTTHLDEDGNIVTTKISTAQEEEKKALRELCEENEDFDIRQLREMVAEIRQRNKKLEESFLF